MVDEYGGPIATPDLVESQGKPGGLGSKIENTIIRAFTQIVEKVATTTADIMRAGLIAALHALFPGTRELFDELYDNVLALESTPPEVRRLIQRAREGKHEADPITLLLGGISLLIGIVTGSLGPIQRLLSYEVDRKIVTARVDPELGARLYFRGIWPFKRVVDQLRDLGWPEEDIAGLIDAMRSRPQVGDVVAAYYRGMIDEQGLKYRLGELGFDTADREMIMGLSERIPPINDIISFAVREAFDEETIQRFQYLLDFPEELAKWAYKQGLSEYWAKRYWVAHWQLPSVQLGYRMFHTTTERSTDPNADIIRLPSGKTVKNVIGEDTLKLLLRVSDIAPFWRDKLMEISYLPYNRVDVRRMFKQGVLDIDDVYRSYLDIGYPPEKAAALTEWTIMEYGESNRDLSKTDILIAYRQRRLTREAAAKLLLELSYDEDEVNILLGREDYKVEEQKEKAVIKVTKQRYLMNQIDRGEVWAELGRIDLPEERIRMLLELWDVDKQRKARRPSLRDLISFLSNGIISPNEFAEEMSNLGYSDKYIKWYLASIGG